MHLLQKLPANSLCIIGVDLYTFSQYLYKLVRVQISVKPPKVRFSEWLISSFLITSYTSLTENIVVSLHSMF